MPVVLVVPRFNVLKAFFPVFRNTGLQWTRSREQNKLLNQLKSLRRMRGARQKITSKRWKRHDGVRQRLQERLLPVRLQTKNVGRVTQVRLRRIIRRRAAITARRRVRRSTVRRLVSVTALAVESTTRAITLKEVLLPAWD